MFAILVAMVVRHRRRNAYRREALHLLVLGADASAASAVAAAAPGDRPSARCAATTASWPSRGMRRRRP